MARRLFVRGIAILSLVIIAAGCAEYVLNLRTKRKAEALLRDARTLEIGKSTEEDVQRIVARYGGESGLVGSGYCDPSAKPHSVYVANSGLNWLGRTSRLLRPFGNRHWSVEVAFLMNHERLCAVVYHVRAFRSDGVWEIAVRADYQERSESPVYTQPPYQVSARIFKNFLDFTTSFTTDATEVQRQHALDFDLTCLTRWQGCRAPCELMRSAWLDYQENARKQGLEMRHDELDDSRCTKLAESQSRANPW